MRNLTHTIVLALATAVLALFPQAAHAQVNVLLAGLRTDKSVTVIEGGQQRVTQPTGGNPMATVDPMKNYVVYEGDCSYVVVEEGTPDQRRCDDQTDSSTRQPGDECQRCRRLAGYISRGVWRPATSAGSSQQSGVNLTPFGYVGFHSTTITNADEAVAVIDNRFSIGNYNPNRQITVDEGGRGVAVGGGVDFAFGSAPIGIRVAVNWEGDRTVPTQTVAGERTLNGLRFSQEGETTLGSKGLFLGPRIRLGSRVAVSAGASWRWWNAEHHQTARLQALCPNACITVNSDDVRETTSGTSAGFQASAEALVQRALAIYVAYSQHTYDGAYDPSDSLAYPTDWKDQGVIVGAMIRF